ncbi:hypothetical protein BS47DRAFT_1341868, partial [Hydnum rufescens UP504]
MITGKISSNPHDAAIRPRSPQGNDLELIKPRRGVLARLSLLIFSIIRLFSWNS